jgi:multidrug efflux pump subunit AcrA (membrane-fusion protein)
VQYFGVTLKLDKSDTKVMKPGARVKASVELANMKNALLVPRQAVFEVKGDRVVYVRRGGRFSAAPVTIEGSTAGRVVVTKGLKAGDVIALSDPEKESEKSTEESGT